MTDVTLRDRLRERGLWPHQADFVETVLASDSGARFLLADAVGLGKTASCAAALRELAAITPAPLRFAVIAPAPLVGMWSEELRQFGNLSATVVDPATYRHLELETSAAENPWTRVDSVVTSVDLVKGEERARQFTTAAWDVVVIDEAHLCTAGSQRGRLFHLIWNQPSVNRAIAVSATPHFGFLEDFEPLVGSKTKIVRRLGSELLDWDGKPILAKRSDRQVEWITVAYSEPEVHLFEALKSLPAENERDKFGALTLLRRAASSLFALEQSLRRLIAREQGVLSAGEEFWEDTDLQVVTTVAVARPEWADKLAPLLNLLDEVESDGKWAACIGAIDDSLARHPHVVLFTEYRDTALYVLGLLRSAGRTAEILTGAQSINERVDACKGFRERGGVLVTTMTEGMTLEFVKACVHYDIPWSPMVLEERFGRIHRINAPPGPVVHYFLADGVFGTDRLLQKSLAVEPILGEASPFERFRPGE